MGWRNKALGRRLALLILAGTAGSAWALPSYTEVQRDFRSSETLVLSREGQVLQRQRTDRSLRRGQWVGLQEISPALRLALLASEDKRFYAHSGVDWQAVSAAAWGNLWNRRTRGASTITMQLAGLLDDDWRASSSGRSMTQKLGQAVAATQLERSWRKDQVLESYLNLVPFRGELVGIDALSRSLFGKAAHGLNAEEAAIAAALIRGPNAKPAQVAQRACGVLAEVAELQAAGRPPASTRERCQALEWRIDQVLAARLWLASEGIAPHWARRTLREVGPEGPLPARVNTTLSAPLQRVALESLQRHLRELQGRNIEDGAVLVLDNASGQVLAWVGSSGSLSQAQEVDGVLAWRQPGSTLKPFLYAQAIDQGRLTAASLLEDSPAQIATGSGLYIPQNYDRRFKGWVSVRTALAASLNVPAVRALVMVSPDAFHAQLRDLGLGLRENAGFYGYSLALGSPEVPLLQLTNAFRALANGGVWSPIAAGLQGAPAVKEQRAALSPQAAFIIGDILSDSQARATTFGLDSVLATRFWTAVKTGTSKDMRDNWAVGWSQRYTVGVWVGNAGGGAMHGVSGSSGAAPVWAEVMGWLHADQPSRPPAPPAGLVRTPVHFVGAGAGGLAMLESDRQEWFRAGTQQAEFAVAPRQPAVPAGASRSDASRSDASRSDASRSDASRSPASRSADSAAGSLAVRITQPVSGSILAIDPDIPPQRQRLVLRARSANGPSPARPDWRWQLHSLSGQPSVRDLGRGASVEWMPWPGRQRIELRDGQGALLDSVLIEVRGAGVK